MERGNFINEEGAVFLFSFNKSYCCNLVLCLGVSLAIGVMTGCSSLYLHDASIEKSTALAKADFDKLKVDAVFDNEATYLDTLEKEETSAVRDRGAALRDHSILLSLQGNDKMDGRTLLLGRIDGYLKYLTGKSDRVSDKKLWRIIDDWEPDKPVEDLKRVLDDNLPNIQTSPEITVPIKNEPTVINNALPSPTRSTITAAMDSFWGDGNSSDKSVKARMQ